MPGDTLKVYHFTAALRREKHYMYKYVTRTHPSGLALDVSHLDQSSQGYNIRLDGKVHHDTEIVQGYGGVPLGRDFRNRNRISVKAVAR